jgi:hypothetical protein
MPRVRYELTILVSKLAKTADALEHSAIVTGQ